MNILVTGGAGFIGSHLVEALVATDHRVRVVDNLWSGNKENLSTVMSKIEFIQGDVSDKEVAWSTTRDIDAVFHLAGLPSIDYSISNPRESHRACFQSTFCLLDAITKSKVKKVVFAGSSSAYGEQTGSCCLVSASSNPTSPYAASKLASEYYIKTFGECFDFQWVILRYFNVYGPRQGLTSYSGVICKFISAINAREEPVIFGSGNQTRDFVHIKDVVQANLLALASGQSGLYNVGTGKGTSVANLLREIARWKNVEVNPEYKPSKLGDVQHCVADIDKTRSELGYAPSVELREGLTTLNL